MKKKNKFAILIFSIIFVLLILFVFAFKFYYAKLEYKNAELTRISEEEKERILKEQMNASENSDAQTIEEVENKIKENIAKEGANIKYDNDIYNILLIGTDNRDSVSGSRSDCIILCSLNKKTNNVTLTSFMRDSYVSIPGYGNNRLNASYSFGGTQLLIDTLESNFKINIDKYVSVDFFSFMDIVDAVGGIDMELTDEEISVLNDYLNEVNVLLGEKAGTDYISGKAGLYHLNGKQTLAFARNRYTGNSDFSRTERQRKILVAIEESVKNSNIIELNNLLLKVLPYITTDLTQGECFSLLLEAPSYLKNKIISNRVPYDNAYKPVTIKKMAVLSLDFEKNIENIYKDIYNK